MAPDRSLIHACQFGSDLVSVAERLGLAYGSGRNRSNLDTMRSLSAIIALAGFLIALALAPEAWAQAQPPEPACTQASGGVDCSEATRRGGWGLIVLGAIFFAVWFMPPRADSEKGRGFMDSLPIMGTLQRRIDKELSGWRRFQWPLIGLSFMSLGFAFLYGWL